MGNLADPALLHLLSQADRALGELNAFSQLVPKVDFFIQMYVAKEATYSSRIEGTQTNVEDAFKDAADVAPEKRDDVSALLKIAVAHYQFETIHPFLDGNGRLGRLLIPLFLASEQILAKPALYLSDYFERNKTAYVDHLMAVRQGNHLREWLLFFLHGVAETAQSSIAVFKSILLLKERIDRDILPRFGVRRQENAQQLMRYLYRKPVVDVKTVTKLLETTQKTAGSLVDDLVSYGVLAEITGQRRNRLFVFREYLALFTR